MLANDPLEKRVAPKVEVEVEAERPTAVDAMAPAAVRDVDPEAGMPRWRRPSLLEARRSDPTRPDPISRIPIASSCS